MFFLRMCKEHEASQVEQVCWSAHCDGERNGEIWPVIEVNVVLAQGQDEARGEVAGPGLASSYAKIMHVTGRRGNGSGE